MNPLALAALVLGFTVNRDPGGDAIVWDPAQVTMSIQVDGSDDIDDGSDLVVMREALDAWSAACSDFVYVEGPPTSSRAYDPEDGTNTITFLEDEWPAFAFGAVGFAPESINLSSLPHRRIGVDIIINGFENTWATDGNPTRPDIGGVVTHELGHALGLWHSSDTDATMYFGSKRGGTQARILGVDDIRGLCFLYPRNPFQCVVDDDCPLYYGTGGRTVCATGTCVAGLAGFGLDCSDAAQCQSGSCIAVRYTPGGNPGFCTQGCDTVAQDCPAGLCSQTSGAPLCYPHRENCVFDPADCGGAPWECVWDLDLVQRCLRGCADDGDCGALAGTVCYGGYCRTPGVTVAGDSCTNSAECESLACGGPGLTCQALPSEDDGAPNGGDSAQDGGDPVPDGGDSAPDGGDPRPDGGDSMAGGGDATADGGAMADGGDATADGGDATADGGDATADGGDATADGGDATADGGDATADGGDATADDGDATADDGALAGDGDGASGDGFEVGNPMTRSERVWRLSRSGCQCDQTNAGLAAISLVLLVGRRRRQPGSSSPAQCE